MILLFGVQLFLCYTYLLVISWITNKWDEIDEILIPKTFVPHHSFSIIIAYRNEAQHIGPCIQSILELREGPKFEIITINDHSSDQSVKVINAFESHLIKNISSSFSGKKAALELGISQAQNEFIITLDADCVVHKDWLKLIDHAITEKALDVVVGPVKFAEEKSFLARFQFMDMSATIATTAAGIHSKIFHLCNGANFIYKKSLYDKVNGFEGNRHIASGDDVFLLQKFIESDVHIGFLKSNRGAVTTKSEPSWKDLFRQRKRWATKTKAYANDKLLQLQAFVFGMCLLSLINFFLLPFIIGDGAIIIGMFILFIKGLIDFLFLNKMVRFFGGKKILKAFIPAFVYYHFYYLIIGIQAIIPTTVDWKGRNV